MCLVPGGVSGPRASVCGLRGCLVLGGHVCSGEGVVSQHGLRQTPPLWTESQMPVKTFPWPNFVAAGKKSVLKFKLFMLLKYLIDGVDRSQLQKSKVP